MLRFFVALFFFGFVLFFGLRFCLCFLNTDAFQGMCVPPPLVVPILGPIDARVIQPQDGAFKKKKGEGERRVGWGLVR